jgi:hypothetical protein
VGLRGGRVCRPEDVDESEALAGLVVGVGGGETVTVQALLPLPGGAVAAIRVPADAHNYHRQQLPHSTVAGAVTRGRGAEGGGARPRSSSPRRKLAALRKQAPSAFDVVCGGIEAADKFIYRF